MTKSRQTGHKNKKSITINQPLYSMVEPGKGIITAMQTEGEMSTYGTQSNNSLSDRQGVQQTR